MVDFESYVGTCFDESFGQDAFNSDEAVQRSKRSFDEKLLDKAEKLNDFQEVVKLYHTSQVVMTNRIVDEVRKLNRVTTEKFDELNLKVDTISAKVNETVVGEFQKFYLSDFYNCIVGWWTGKDLTNGKTIGYIVQESSPWAGIWTILVGILGWLDARFASKLAKYFGFKLSPYNKVKN